MVFVMAILNKLVKGIDTLNLAISLSKLKGVTFSTTLTPMSLLFVCSFVALSFCLLSFSFAVVLVDG